MVARDDDRSGDQARLEKPSPSDQFSFRVPSAALITRSPDIRPAAVDYGALSSFS
jgi:hypothetical protein